MNTLTTRIAAVAALTLAALPIAALATNVSAARAPVAIQVADLDLNTTEGLATFQNRADVAVNAFCSSRDASSRQLSVRSECRSAVRAEISDKLAKAQQRQLAAKAGMAVTFAAR